MYHNGGSPPAEIPGLAPMPAIPQDPAVDLNMSREDIMVIQMNLSQLYDGVSSTPQAAWSTSPFPQQQLELQRGVPASNNPNDAYALHPQDSSMTGIVAGPLPTCFGAAGLYTSGSTFTEFTKRRNWSQRVLQELRDFLHILTPHGRILYASASCKALTGWEPQQLIGRLIREFIHPDDSGIFVEEFNESTASGNPFRLFYRFRRTDETWAIFEAHGHPNLSDGPSTFAPPNTINCGGFFMMARPYPTKNAALLDSFLEHKIESERLMKRIAELKREEEEEEAEAQDRPWQKKTDGASLVTPSDTQGQSESVSASPIAAYNALPSPAKPGVSNTVLRRQNMDEALAASEPDSIDDKMARYEGATHLETTEISIGLRYREGERSQSNSTGEHSPMLIRGDADIEIALDCDGRISSHRKKTKEKKKIKMMKLKIADEHVCTDCGTLDSPEWRKGPNGPRTLCNACGLRWAKEEKKKQSQTDNAQTSHTSALPMHTVKYNSGSTNGCALPPQLIQL